MFGKLIKHIKDLLLELGVSSSLTGVKFSHFHIVSFVINVIITDVSSFGNIRLIVDESFTITFSFTLESGLFSIKFLISWSVLYDEFLWGVVVFLLHIR